MLVLALVPCRLVHLSRHGSAHQPPFLTLLPSSSPPSLRRSYNKQVLKAFPYPLTITALQFAIGSLWCCVMWLLRLHKKPEGNFVENVSGPVAFGWVW